MKHVFTAARILLGILLMIGGINGFYQFMEVPEFHPFMQILVDSGYLYVVKTLEILAATLLLRNRNVPLALLMITPVAINIGLYHLLIDPRNAIAGILVVLFTGVLLWQHRRMFLPIISAD